MPLSITVPQETTVTIDTLQITSFAVDIDGTAIYVTFDEGHMDQGAFVVDNKDRIIAIAGAEFAAAIALADTYANAMAQGSVSVYSALKSALYDKLMAITGLSGTVR